MCEYTRVCMCMCVSTCMHVCQAPEKHWCFHVYKEIPGAILYRSPLLLALESDPDIHIELLGSRRPGSFQGDRGQLSQELPLRTPLWEEAGHLEENPCIFWGRGGQ